MAVLLPIHLWAGAAVDLTAQRYCFPLHHRDILDPVNEGWCNEILLGCWVKQDANLTDKNEQDTYAHVTNWNTLLPALL